MMARRMIGVAGRLVLLAGLLAPEALLAADAPPLHQDRAAVEAKDGSDIVPRYYLMGPTGAMVTNSDFPGKFQLITFGYTSCPDVCPTTLQEMTTVLNTLGERRKHVQPIFITLDPARDTRRHLYEFTRFFSTDILGLTGSVALLDRAASNFKVKYAKVVNPGDPADRYSLDHTAGIYVLGPDGAFVKKYAYGADPKLIAKELEADLVAAGK